METKKKGKTAHLIIINHQKSSAANSLVYRELLNGFWHKVLEFEGRQDIGPDQLFFIFIGNTLEEREHEQGVIAFRIIEQLSRKPWTRVLLTTEFQDKWYKDDINYVSDRNFKAIRHNKIGRICQNRNKVFINAI